MMRSSSGGPVRRAGMWRRVAILGLASCLTLAPARAAELRFDLAVGALSDHFLRDGDVSAHLVLGGGRVVAALPAGNGGVGLWSDADGRATAMTLMEPLRAVARPDAQGRPLYGVTAALGIAADHFVIRRAVLANVRVLRDVQHGGPLPAAVATAPVPQADGSVLWRRDRLDGAAGFELSLRPLDGGMARVGADGGVTLLAGAGGQVRVEMTALSGEPPLHPIDAADLLNDRAQMDEKARHVLAFLSYREKLMAGSWAYNTYFGRDTLMSLRLLMPALKPAAMEAGLGAVLERLNPAGEVAHEEDVGEFAIQRHQAEGRPGRTDPLLDYKMIDDDFMLAPVIADYLLSPDHGVRAAQLFLARRTPAGEAYGSLLVRNLSYVMAQAGPFAADPSPARLLSLHAGSAVGQWRDSQEGLGEGRIAYDVNAVLVPAALDAADRLHRSGLLAAYGAAAAGLDRAAGLARTWRERAPALFAVTVPADRARDRVAAYARRLGVDPAPALAALPAGPVRFNALSLNAAGAAIPVLHSDDGFALLFLDPPAATVDRTLSALFRPFPAGLMTGAGMVVANAAFADPALQPQFGPDHYHGAVVWSWQQALMAAGIQRQSARRDLPPATMARLRAAEAVLWQAIRATADMRTSELWSWTFADGRYAPRPFGQSAGDQTESNAAQLWSTVYLGIRPPAR